MKEFKLLDIKTEVTFKAKTGHYELELNCVNDLYSFYVYTEAGNIEASFNGVSKDEINDIISFLMKGIG